LTLGPKLFLGPYPPLVLKTKLLHKVEMKT